MSDMSIRNAIDDVPKRIDVCPKVGAMLSVSGRPLTNDAKDKRGQRTDWDRCRSQVRARLKSLRRDIRLSQDVRVRPALTALDITAAKMQDCCSECPAHNITRVQEGRPFECLIQQQRVSFRFQRGDDKEIIEHDG